MVHKDVVCQHFTLTPALSLKGEGELKDPGLNCDLFDWGIGVIGGGTNRAIFGCSTT